ncbi:hypothetical protein AAJ76_1100012845 [Vairimorpha ceranae]|uniref:Uncharacterized protein n=1 Tax=Vairimorpha ceranae TaxID=40302 RepID=A0A0F9YTF0_9MICR|nr:hypothetical protein AAJ76_1100012845 [Vairimorpha ceranae]KKO75812.1 hypothetical protein AAJ76_1100012845 [Vairimorpha ceranae]
MPMNKLNVLFWMSYIHSLQILSVVPQTYKMYEINLRNTYPGKYDFYIKNHYPPVDKIPIITEVKSPLSNIQGFVYIHSNQTTDTYIKSLYCFSSDFTDTNQIFYQFEFTTALKQKNILNIQIPSMLFNNALESQYGIEVKKTFGNISNIGLKIQNNFTEFILLNKAKTISSSRQLLDELTNRPGSRIKHSLESEDYILAFFDRDYNKIISFLNEFISLLQEDDVFLQHQLPMFFINFVKNNLNTFWEEELIFSFKDFNTFKDIHLLNCFFTDLKNLFWLIEDPNHKFALTDHDQCIGSLYGNSCVNVLFNFQEDVDEKTLKCFVYDKKNNKLNYKLMIDTTKRKIFIMFKLRYLKESNIKQIDCIIQTPKKHFKSCDINLIGYL